MRVGEFFIEELFSQFPPVGLSTAVFLNSILSQNAISKFLTITCPTLEDVDPE